jgi:hypothetical protein
MYLFFEFEFGFRISFPPVQANQLIELVDSPLTNLRYTCGKLHPLFVEQSLNRNDSSHGPTWMLRFPFLSGV